MTQDKARELAAALQQDATTLETLETLAGVFMQPTAIAGRIREAAAFIESLAPEEGAVARMLPTGELEIFGDLKIGARLFLRPDPRVSVLREALTMIARYELSAPEEFREIARAALASTGDQDG